MLDIRESIKKMLKTEGLRWAGVDKGFPFETEFTLKVKGVIRTSSFMYADPKQPTKAKDGNVVHAIPTKAKEYEVVCDLSSISEQIAKAMKAAVEKEVGAPLHLRTHILKSVEFASHFANEEFITSG